MSSLKVNRMRFLVPVLSLAGLVACTNPPLPDPGTGVGFDSYSDYQAQRTQRENLLNGTAGAISTEPITSGAITPTTIQPGAPLNATAQPSVDVNNPGISDEQDFSAVASRETIESDKQRIEANREAYQVIQPTALPDRPGKLGPSIVEYALSTRNSVGQQQYSRSTLFAESKFNKNCAKYASSDQAQEAFLAAGGPDRDRMGLDPDGDGFACYWDPAPFRQARSQ